MKRLAGIGLIVSVSACGDWEPDLMPGFEPYETDATTTTQWDGDPALRYNRDPDGYMPEDALWPPDAMIARCAEPAPSTLRAEEPLCSRVLALLSDPMTDRVFARVAIDRGPCSCQGERLDEVIHVVDTDAMAVTHTLPAGEVLLTISRVIIYVEDDAPTLHVYDRASLAEQDTLPVPAATYEASPYHDRLLASEEGELWPRRWVLDLRDHLSTPVLAPTSEDTEVALAHWRPGTRDELVGIGDVVEDVAAESPPRMRLRSWVLDGPSVHTPIVSREPRLDLAFEGSVDASFLGWFLRRTPPSLMSQDGQMALIHSAALHMVSLSTGEVTVLEGFSRSVALTPDGRRVLGSRVVAHDEDGTLTYELRRYDVETGSTVSATVPWPTPATSTRSDVDMPLLYLTEDGDHGLLSAASTRSQPIALALQNLTNMRISGPRVELRRVVERTGEVWLLDGGLFQLDLDLYQTRYHTLGFRADQMVYLAEDDLFLMDDIDAPLLHAVTPVRGGVAITAEVELPIPEALAYPWRYVAVVSTVGDADGPLDTLGPDVDAISWDRDSERAFATEVVAYTQGPGIPASSDYADATAALGPNDAIPDARGQCDYGRSPPTFVSLGASPGALVVELPGAVASGDRIRVWELSSRTCTDPWGYGDGYSVFIGRTTEPPSAETLASGDWILLGMVSAGEPLATGSFVVP